MRYGLIGCGRISPNHITAALGNKLEIVGICDILPEAMEEKAWKFNLPTTVARYADYLEMLDEAKPELVAICTESGKHAQIAIDCLERGAHVIIEKPIALSLADADCILEAA
ncbi:MAG: Gfo/Idh/MocA family oxidoreductase, partial [Actinobacteria bacterium]|nr:Gfo/Idh/MocA family oxidoreductase [Actinomycetota bacterium]